MVHLIATLFFAGVLVGLALVLQFTIRAHWQDMVAALFGRPMARHRVTGERRVLVSVPRSHRSPRAVA